MPTPPCILTIAGSDSGGGAGIQADLKTITVIGGFGMSVITALTAQNGVGVAGIHAPEPGFVGLQLKTVREGFPIAAAKTGMLFSAEIIEAVEAGLQGREFPLVVDPVCVSQSGQRLLREDAVNALRWHILPKADLLTPNRPEAELLADMKIDSERMLTSPRASSSIWAPRPCSSRAGISARPPMPNSRTGWPCRANRLLR